MMQIICNHNYVIIQWNPVHGGGDGGGVQPYSHLSDFGRMGMGIGHVGVFNEGIIDLNTFGPAFIVS